MQIKFKYYFFEYRILWKLVKILQVGENNLNDSSITHKPFRTRYDHMQLGSRPSVIGNLGFY